MPCYYADRKYIYEAAVYFINELVGQCHRNSGSVNRQLISPTGRDKYNVTECASVLLDRLEIVRFIHKARSSSVI